MHGERLLIANRKAAKVFKKYHGFSPRNENCAGSFYYNYSGTRIDRWTPDEIERLVGFYRKTKVPCSCYACGNPRRHGEIPLDEIRGKDEFLAQIDDFYDYGDMD
jgi:hypothetical protein